MDLYVQLARKTVETYIRDRKIYEPQPEELTEDCAAVSERLLRSRKRFIWKSLQTRSLHPHGTRGFRRSQ